jgi:hypothetical protein
MRQVPGKASLLLIGDGRLANHLHHYLKLSRLEVARWSRKGNSQSELGPLLGVCDRVLLAISDGAIEGFVREYRTDPAHTWVHFSGGTVVKGAWSVHPLCTFSGAPYELETYKAIPFLVEREGPSLEELIPGLENPSLSLPGSSKPLYHALCVTAGNFTQLLWLHFFQAFEDNFGISSEFCLPFMRQTFLNLERNDVENVATGPIARQDRETIKKNIKALRGAKMDPLADVYESFLEFSRIKALEEVS